MSVFIFASISWIVSAHKWFTGPIVNVTDDDNSSESSRSSDDKHIEEEKRQS